MARLFRPTRPLLDRSGQPVIGPDGRPKRVPRTMNWFIRVDANGKAHDIATHTDKITVAKRMASDLESKKNAGEDIAARLNRITFEDALKAVIDRRIVVTAALTT